ncbi:MAG: hypothetical protein ABI551_09915 [Polyangiaceae bacterium]
MRHQVFLVSLFVLSAATYGCSSSSTTPSTSPGNASGANGTAAISGTVQGKSLAAFTTALADVDSSPTQGALTITISDLDTCDDATAGPRKSSSALTLALTVRTDMDAGDGTTTTFAAPTQPGTFTADGSGANGAYVEYTPLDAACLVTQNGVEKWRTGTVTVTSLTNGVLSGSFDVAAGDISSGGDHLTGTFTTAKCPGSGELYAGEPAPGDSAPAPAGTCH